MSDSHLQYPYLKIFFHLVDAGTTCVNWRLSASSLTQTNCLLLSPALVRRATRGRRPGYVEILDALFSHGCVLSEGSAVQWSAFHNVSLSRSYH